MELQIYLSQSIFDSGEEIDLGYLHIRGFIESNHAKFLDHDINLDATDDIKHMGILLLTPVTHVKYQEDIFNMDYAEG